MWERREVERCNAGEERKKEREFGLVEPGRLRERSRGFEGRQHCHPIFGLKSSIGQVRKGKER